MKVFLALVLLTIISLNTVAQESSIPLRMSKNLLVHSAGLPEEFLPFASDTATQIVFNPSRGNTFSSSFIYANYLSDYSTPVYYYPVYSTSQFEIGIDEIGYQFSPALLKGSNYNFPGIYQENYSLFKNPTFSAVSLLKDEDMSWLFSFYHGLSNADNQVLSSNNNLNNYFQDFQQIHTYSNFTRFREASETALKVSGLWGSGDMNFSLGLFGILYNTDEQVFRQDGTSRVRHRHNYFDTDTTRNSYYSNTYQNSISDNGIIKKAIGLEFGLSSNNFDYVGSFSYQVSEAPEENEVNYVSLQYDSSFGSNPVRLNYRYSLESRNQNAHLESSPYILTFENYYQHNVGWITPGDNAFLSFNCFYAPDNKAYSFRSDHRQYYDDNGRITADTLISSQSGKLETKSWGYNLSLGYVLRTTLSDIDIVSGLRFNIMHSRFEDINDAYSGSTMILFYRYSETFQQTGFLLPVYLNYTPVKWASVFGGFNYYYYFNSETIEGNADNMTRSFSGQTYEADDHNYSDSESWLTSKSIYIGCELRHDSGLRVQFYFDDSITSVQNWNVSLGYHF